MTASWRARSRRSRCERGRLARNSSKPVFERLDLVALLGGLGVAQLAVKAANVFQPLFRTADGQGVILGLERLRGAGAREHHHELRLKLPEGQGEVLGLGVFADKLEDRQVALGIPYHRRVVFEWSRQM